ncbi:hypothetical protein D9M73_127930 [compost metagenome]
MKRIIVGHDRRLLMRDLAEFAQCRRFTAQPVGQRGNALGDLGVTRHDGFTQVIKIDLGPRIQQRGEQGDADGPAEVAQDVEQARCRSCILGQDVGRRDQRDGDHDQRLAQGADDLDLIELRPGKVRVQHARRETRQPE